MERTLRVAVEGCCHGQLDKIYQSIKLYEQKNNKEIDLLIICGDFQAARTEADLLSMSVPEKYRKMGDFCSYFKGLKKAPVPTLFIGGNHEASNYMWDLYYGGWACHNIFFLGFSGIVNFAGLRIGGISGIYNERHYEAGYYEKEPFRNNDIKSIYHTRKYEAFKLLQSRGDLDVFISHDWPKKIYRHGDIQDLLQKKPYFKSEVQNELLGSPCNQILLQVLKPRYWFSAHLHVKFEALVEHGSDKKTQFLALDKCLPDRSFLEILEIPVSSAAVPHKFCYDAEWLAIVKAADKYMEFRQVAVALPNELDVAEIQQNKHWVQQNIKNLEVPYNFDVADSKKQGIEYCQMLGIPYRLTRSSQGKKHISNEEEIKLD